MVTHWFGSSKANCAMSAMDDYSEYLEKVVLKRGAFIMGNKVIRELTNYALWIGVSMVIGYLLHVTYPVHNSFSELLVPILVCGIVAGTICDIDERETNE